MARPQQSLDQLNSAMLVGTVAALQQESGQLRNQWKCDVSRLESELAQLRSAAAWALPQLAEAQGKEPNLRLMGGSALERSSSLGALGNGQIEKAMMQGALADRLSRERGLDALLAHGTGGQHLIGQSSQLEAAAAMMPQTARGAPLPEQRLEALLRQGGAAGGGGLAREAAQLEAMMLQGAASESANRDRMMMMQRNASTGNIRDASGLADAMQRTSDQVAGCSSAASERGRAASTVCTEQASQNAEQTKLQMLELYKELENITMTLQEAQAENRKLKEDKDASETAHARDVAALEGMLQQLTADNERLSKSLAKAERDLKGKSHPSTPASIRTASQEPAIEPDVESVDFDRIKFKIGH